MPLGVAYGVRYWLACALVLAGCGTRSALDRGRARVDAGLPDAAPPPPPDAGRDAGPPPDAGTDAGPPPDAGPPCVRDRAFLPTGDVDVVFVIDRSASMGWTILDGSQSRWEIVLEAMEDVFGDLDPRVGSGALMFPSGPFCTLDDELHVTVAEDNVARVLAALDGGVIDGRSPIGLALSNAYAAFERDRPDRANRFVVLLSDGDAERCGGVVFPEISVSDARGLGIDTFGVAVAGDVSSVVAGGGRRHYDARDLDQLRSILTEIEGLLTGCVFEVPFEPSHPDHVTVRVGGAEVDHDPRRLDGWGWTGAGARSISLYGSACARRLEEAAAVEAIVACEDPDGGVVGP